MLVSIVTLVARTMLVVLKYAQNWKLSDSCVSSHENRILTRTNVFLVAISRNTDRLSQ